MRKYIKLLKLSEIGMKNENEGKRLYVSDFELFPCFIEKDGTIKEVRIISEKKRGKDASRIRN